MLSIGKLNVFILCLLIVCLSFCFYCFFFISEMNFFSGVLINGLFILFVLVLFIIVLVCISVFEKLLFDCNFIIDWKIWGLFLWLNVFKYVLCNVLEIVMVLWVLVRRIVNLFFCILVIWLLVKRWWCIER